MLIHFTKSLSALDSITRNGFLYLHNETGILGPAIQAAFGVSDFDSQSNGMVCFTEIPSEQTASHQEVYGQYGVGVSKEWLIANNARKVVYVEPTEDALESLVQELRDNEPRLRGIPILELLSDASTRQDAIFALSGTFTSEADKLENRGYLRILEYLSWSQTHQDVAEAEWRIRNPRPYRFTGAPTRKQQIDLLVSCISDKKVQDVFDGLVNYTLDGEAGLVCVGRLSLVLPLPRQAIRAIFCPKGDAGRIRYALWDSGMSHVGVYVREGDGVYLST